MYATIKQNCIRRVSGPLPGDAAFSGFDGISVFSICNPEKRRNISKYNRV